MLVALAQPPPNKCRPGPKTRVRKFFSGRANCTGTFSSQARETRREIRPAVRRTAVGSRCYLQPEPLLQAPMFVENEALAGFQASAYAYARNSPVRFVDPNGLQAVIPVPWSGPIEVPVLPGPPSWNPLPLIFWPSPLAPGTCPNGPGTCGQDPPPSWTPAPPVPDSPLFTPSPSNVCEMANGGKQNIRNHYYYLAKQQPDPWRWLREQYRQASGAARAAIIQAQKALECRGSRGGWP